MPLCRICLKERTDAQIKFDTPRMRICRFCVRTLNETRMTRAEALAHMAARLRSYLERVNAERLTSDDPAVVEQARWNLNNLDSFIAGCMADGFANQVQDRKRHSIPIKIIRAHNKGLILADRRATPYPRHWNFTSVRIRHEDGWQCNRCKRRRDDHPELVLHAHHIVHHANGGSNDRTNLVTLCFACHQRQHPGIRMSIVGDEPDAPTSPPVEHSSHVPLSPSSPPTSPTPDLVDAMTVAGAYIESGTRSFDDFTRAMVSDLGESVRPHLLVCYEGIRNYPGINADGMTSPAEAERIHKGLPPPSAAPPSPSAKPSGQSTASSVLGCLVFCIAALVVWMVIFIAIGLALG